MRANTDLQSGTEHEKQTAQDAQRHLDVATTEALSKITKLQCREAEMQKLLTLQSTQKVCIAAAENAVSALLSHPACIPRIAAPDTASLPSRDRSLLPSPAARRRPTAAACTSSKKPAHWRRTSTRWGSTSTHCKRGCNDTRTQLREFTGRRVGA